MPRSALRPRSSPAAVVVLKNLCLSSCAFTVASDITCSRKITNKGTQR